MQDILYLYKNMFLMIKVVGKCTYLKMWSSKHFLVYAFSCNRIKSGWGLHIVQASFLVCVYVWTYLVYFFVYAQFQLPHAGTKHTCMHADTCARARTHTHTTSCVLEAVGNLNLTSILSFSNFPRIILTH